MKHIVFYVLILVSILISSCASSQTKTSETPTTENQATEVNMSLEITSNAFANGQSIPVKYSCKGNNISPDLAWNEPPAGTESFALIVDDPDAPMGTWVHWVLYNLPASERNLKEDLPITGKNTDPN